ncbi:hypothetical protein Q5530_36530 [Saccharothrix sp. BKS2]|uniref:hypothetical protein n=1 Tax=Saccharothrix sp. BKS2 TaxID=3064400 RepID=UPI0039E841D1
MIIRDEENQSGVVKFLLMSADETRAVPVEVPDGFADDFRDHLASAGFRLPRGAARSVLVEVVVAVAESPAAWTAVGGTVVAFLGRHRGKVHRFEVNGNPVSIEGYSARDAERLAAELHGSGHEPGGEPNRESHRESRRETNRDPGEDGGMTLGSR